MDNDQIKHMVNRFLMWKLPEHFRPDCGIIYTPIRIADGRLLEPSGTNLLDATQAEAMVRHMIEGLPAARPASGEREGEESELSEKDLAMIDWAWETHKAAAPAPSPPSQAENVVPMHKVPPMYKIIDGKRIDLISEDDPAFVLADESKGDE